MANRAHKRLSKEMTEFNNSDLATKDGVKLDLVNDDITNWNVHIPGPAGSPYDGGRFTVNIDFRDNYPFKCPKLQFVTKIYHPNIKTETGEICAEAIKNSWVPTLNADFIIKMLRELIGNPTAENPMETDIARELMVSTDKFRNTAKEYTEKYAK